MGASFYNLLTLQPYLHDRSFDPKYNNAYVVRMVTGVVSGVILAIVWGFKPAANGGGQQGFDTLRAFTTPAIIAILGGFSAEAVEQILQRVVEVMVTLVRGDNSGAAEAKASADQALKDAAVLKKLPDLSKSVNDPEAFKKSLSDIENLLKRKGG